MERYLVLRQQSTSVVWGGTQIVCVYLFISGNGITWAKISKEVIGSWEQTICSSDLTLGDMKTRRSWVTRMCVSCVPSGAAAGLSCVTTNNSTQSCHIISPFLFSHAFPNITPWQHKWTYVEHLAYSVKHNCAYLKRTCFAVPRVTSPEILWVKQNWHVNK